MNINTGKHLLVDDRCVEDIWNLRREVVRPAKCIDNPLMVADRPWEDKGVGGCYVLFDEQENLFKMCYNVFNYVAWNNEEDHCYTYWICYAESKDGLSWNKPDLGIIEYAGSTNNNLIMQGEWWATIGIVLKENDEPNPQKRYKMLYTDVFGMPSREKVAKDGGIKGEWQGRSGVCMAYSADGIHWQPHGDNPVIDGESDTTNCVFWDEAIGKYVSSANGTIQVEALSADGEIIEGYAKASSVAFCGDSLRHQLQWRHGRTMRALQGQRIRLKFYMSQAIDIRRNRIRIAIIARRFGAPLIG